MEFSTIMVRPVCDAQTRSPGALRVAERPLARLACRKLWASLATSLAALSRGSLAALARTMGNSGSAKHVDARDATVSEVYLQIDPPRPPSFNSIPHRTKGTAVILVSLFLCFGMPFFEPSFIQPHWAWGYEATGFAGLPRAYALVLLCNAVLPTFVMSYLAFGVVSQGRKKYGYKLPVMYASVDIHVLDVAAGGAILSDGNSAAAQQKLEAAAAYSTHQRAHHNALETLQLFLVLSLARRPALPRHHRDPRRVLGDRPRRVGGGLHLGQPDRPLLEPARQPDLVWPRRRDRHHRRLGHRTARRPRLDRASAQYVARTVTLHLNYLQGALQFTITLSYKCGSVGRIVSEKGGGRGLSVAAGRSERRRRALGERAEAGRVHDRRERRRGRDRQEEVAGGGAPRGDRLVRRRAHRVAVAPRREAARLILRRQPRRRRRPERLLAPPAGADRRREGEARQLAVGFPVLPAQTAPPFVGSEGQVRRRGELDASKALVPRAPRGYLSVLRGGRRSPPGRRRPPAPTSRRHRRLRARRGDRADGSLRRRQDHLLDVISGQTAGEITVAASSSSRARPRHQGRSQIRLRVRRAERRAPGHLHRPRDLLLYQVELKCDLAEPAAVRETWPPLDNPELLKLTLCRDVAGDALPAASPGGNPNARTSGAAPVTSRAFLDEPTSGLDSETSSDVVEVMRALAQSGVTVLATIHSGRFEGAGVSTLLADVHAGSGQLLRLALRPERRGAH